MPRQSAKQKENPLPKKQVIAVLAVLLCEGFQVNVLFPFMVFMIRDFGIAAREEDVGRWAGLLAASFCFAQFLSGFFWGWLSDILGRKRVVLIGLCGAFVASAIFGTSKSFGQAMAGRILAGLLSGNIGVLKSFLAEITDNTNRARAFSYIPLAWGAGCIIAPFIGGVLSRPAIQYPSLPWGPFDFFPYLLPCLVGMVLQGVTIVLVIFMMEEPQGTMRRMQSATLRRLISSSCFPWRTGTSAVIEQSSSPMEDDDAVLLTAMEKAAAENELQASPALELESPVEQLESGTNFCKLTGEVYANPREEAQPSTISVLLKREPVLTISMRMLMALATICIDEILPVLMATPSSLGGLGLGSSRIGAMLMTAGVALFITTLLLTPWLLARVKLLSISKVQWLLTIPIIVGLPYLHLLAPLGSIVTLVVTEALLCLRQGVNGTAFTTVSLMVTHSVPKGYLGAANGVGQSLASLVRAIGPAVAGILWAASLDKDLERWFPLRQATLFVILAAINIVGLIITFFIPSSIQYPVDEQPAPQDIEEAGDPPRHNCL